MNNFSQFTSRHGWLNSVICTIKFTASLALILVSCLYISVLRAQADVVVYDHFDDGVLDPAWSISFQDSTGWTYIESGTGLDVTDINPTVINPDSSGTWARVVLSQDFTLLTDFRVGCDFSWDSENSNRAMQSIYMELYDIYGNPLSQFGSVDAWVADRGGSYASAGENNYWSGNTLPYNGSASVDISRVGSNITVLWDEVELVSGEADNPLSRVDVRFSYYAYDGPGGPSLFGTESIDLVKIEGTPVPLPCTLLLFGSGLAGIIGLGRKSLLKKAKKIKAGN